ncbi:PAAR domain-containing protein [Paraburkholderia sp.]|uniref:PAAR domain-containing protein n=1 Tax=Paraburkholderia sp. TaxID=1926495 RepID=UPI0039C940CD
MRAGPDSVRSSAGVRAGYTAPKRREERAMSNVIRVGDRTTVGGVVLDGTGSISTDGRALSFNGARVSCPKCGSMGIARSQPHPTNVVMNGRQVLQAGDQCVCKCPPPVLVASQGIASLNPGGGKQP